MSAIKNKQMRFMEIKEISEDGTFEGLLSPYGNVDHGGDVVEPGAFTKSLQERKNIVTMLWQHKADCPIGTLELEDRPEGLYCKGKLELGVQKAQEAYLLLKKRIIKGLSIGFQTIKESVKDGVRHLHEVKLWEGSVVTFPMNDMAMVFNVKALENKGDFTEELAEIQTLQAFWQIKNALWNALTSVIRSDATKDEKIAMKDTIMQQFAEAFAMFFPAYLDALEKAYGPSETWASSVALETKSGAMISKTNADKMRSACDKIKSGHDDILALCGAEAGETTSESKAAEIKTEPDNHSASEDTETQSIIDGIRKLIA